MMVCLCGYSVGLGYFHQACDADLAFWEVLLRASLVAQMVKNLPAMREIQVRVSGSGRSLGEGNSYPLQYSCLGNSMERGAWWATVHGVAENQT